MSEEAVVIRVFEPERDCEGVEMVERRCEVGPSGKMSLFTDLMGDPICRIRHSPAFLMLVCISLLLSFVFLNDFFLKVSFRTFFID